MVRAWNERMVLKVLIFRIKRRWRGWRHPHYALFAVFIIFPSKVWISIGQFQVSRKFKVVCVLLDFAQTQKYIHCTVLKPEKVVSISVMLAFSFYHDICFSRVLAVVRLLDSNGRAIKTLHPNDFLSVKRLGIHHSTHHIM
jgi:hypothetical protein